MRSSWIIQVGPKSNESAETREKQSETSTHTHARPKNTVRTKADQSDWPPAQEAKECQQAPEARGKGGSFRDFRDCTALPSGQ